MSEAEIRFWKNTDKSKIDPKLYSGIAENFVKKMQKDHEGLKGKPNGKTQIRKFYDEVQRLHMESARLNPEKKEDKEKWDAVLPLVNMLIAKAAYAKGRDRVSENFLLFIRESVEQISEPKDLRVFANFFEAVMGFYPLYIKAN